jgi:hypothetical protein
MEIWDDELNMDVFNGKPFLLDVMMKEEQKSISGCRNTIGIMKI